ncbi:MAG: DsrE family protein [Actinomycetota bacterium]|jgi:predicted peroxiredoxin|nr:DsrE family protein [Actinomycetota bacterium]MDQ3530179.1 DsrE family protein [Actinomycetota bacterium]
MSEKLIFNCTSGAEDPERATLPFIAANVAASAGQEAIVLCTVEAVRLGTHGGTEGVSYEGIPTLADVYGDFIGNGGQVWLCGVCTKPRGITESDCAKGAQIVGAAKVVEEVVGGAKTIAFA